MSTRILASICVLGGCTLATADQDQPIIGGSAAANDAATVLLAAYPSDQSTLFTCSAVVVSPTALLTAAHCLDHAGYTFGMYEGADASAYTTLAQLIPHLAPVTSVHIHPYYDRATPFTADIAVVNLAGATTIAPMLFTRTAPSAGPARIVGYGQTVYGQYNATRMQATTVVAVVDAGDTITVGDAQRHTCIGDSGGPVLVPVGAAEQVAGVDSYADVTGCTGPSHFRRSDLYAAFIDQYAGTSPPAGPDAGVQPPAPDAGTMAGSTGAGGGCAIAGGDVGAPIWLGLCVLGWRRRTRRRRSWVHRI